MCRQVSERRDAGALMPRLGRRAVLRAGAGAAAGFFLGGSAPSTRAMPLRQEANTIRGGRWIEAEEAGLAQQAEPGAFITFATEYPFQAIAPSWSGEGDPDAIVEVLWSPDGVTWSEPLWIGRAGHNGRPDRAGRHIGALVATPGGTFLQYRTYDGDGNLASLPGFELDYIDAAAGPTLEQVAEPATAPAFAKPPVISRVGWGADESLRYDKKGNEIWPLEYQAVEHVIIHHADTANFNDPVLEMRSIYYFHTITRGWGDIGYNYLVDFLGNVYEGRIGGETAVGGHAEGYNTGSCGICLMGRFFDADITPEMHNAIVWITAWAARDLDPVGSAAFHDIPSLPTICGHRDVNNTTCPGDEFYAHLETIRGEVRRVIKGRDDPSPPPPEWYPGMRVVTIKEGNSLREGPGLDFDVVANVAVGERLIILQGPTTNDRIIWYKVQGASLSGWIAGNLLRPDPGASASGTPPDAASPSPPMDDAAPGSGDGGATPVTDLPPEEAAVGGGDEREDRRNRGRKRRQEAWLDFAPGDAVVVIDGPLNLREAPGLSAAILATLPLGEVESVMAGPVDADGLVWYQVVTPSDAAGWCDGSSLDRP